MNLSINGEQRTIDAGTTLGMLLQQLKLEPGQVVLELNREILNPGEHAGKQLQDGDHLEIIQFVGGG